MQGLYNIILYKWHTPGTGEI